MVRKIGCDSLSIATTITWINVFLETCRDSLGYSFVTSLFGVNGAQRKARLAVLEGTHVDPLLRRNDFVPVVGEHTRLVPLIKLLGCRGSDRVGPVVQDDTLGDSIPEEDPRPLVLVPQAVLALTEPSPVKDVADVDVADPRVVEALC